MGVESYKHQFAKATLADWFREVAKENGGYDKGARIHPVSWRVNRSGPNFGVWIEYPIALDKNNIVQGESPGWDETNWDGSRVHQDAAGKEYSWEEYMALPSDTKWVDFEWFQKPDSLLDVRPPTYDEVLKLGYLPIVIFDVAIQHKGCITDAFEVVHRNGISQVKSDYLNRILTCVYTIDADWILSRIKRPEELVCQRVV